MHEKISFYRQLGFTSGTATVESYFGPVPGEFAMDNVFCSPSDNIIQNCEHSDENEENCSGSEGAGVICNQGDSTQGGGEAGNNASGNKMTASFPLTI